MSDLSAHLVECASHLSFGAAPEAVRGPSHLKIDRPIAGAGDIPSRDPKHRYTFKRYDYFDRVSLDCSWSIVVEVNCLFVACG
jgi:hypothetical protein